MNGKNDPRWDQHRALGGNRCMRSCLLLSAFAAVVLALVVAFVVWRHFA